MISEYLVLAGWSAEPWDKYCWLECNDPGYLRKWTDRNGVTRIIALCARHAEILERGSFNGSYSGAPLPADTMSTEWPWCQDEDAVNAALRPWPVRAGAPAAARPAS